MAVGLSVPLFRGLRDRRRTEAADARLDASEQLLLDLWLTLQLEAALARRGVEEHLALARAYEGESRRAEQAAVATRASFQAGPLPYVGHARRMHATALRLCDEVLRHVRYRLWTFTVPRPLRYLVARDPAVLAAVSSLRRLRRRGPRSKWNFCCIVGALARGETSLGVVVHGLTPGEPGSRRELDDHATSASNGRARRLQSQPGGNAVRSRALVWMLSAMGAFALASPARAQTKAPGQVESFYGNFGTEYPIPAPAFHGLEPQIALSYSSSIPDSWTGVGWHLAASSVIERAAPFHRDQTVTRMNRERARMIAEYMAMMANATGQAYGR